MRALSARKLFVLAAFAVGSIQFPGVGVARALTAQSSGLSRGAAVVLAPQESKGSVLRQVTRPNIIDQFIVDDLDEFRPWPCLVAPCLHGTGFLAAGPSNGWNEYEVPGSSYRDHALYTFAGPNWVGEEDNNWASWTPDELLSGDWEVAVHIPTVSIGRTATRRAQYRVTSDDGESIHEVDQANSRGWVVLGTFHFDDTRPSVELRDVTPDYIEANRQKIVLVDAVRWAPPSVPMCSRNSDYRITTLPTLPREGQSFTVRVSGISPDTCIPEYLRYSVVGSEVVISADEGHCDNPFCFQAETDWTFDATIQPLAPGSYTIRLDMVCPNDSDTCANITVDIAANPTHVPSPRPTITPTTRPGPAPTPRPTPTKANPLPVIIVPGYGHSVPELPTTKLNYPQGLTTLQSRLSAHSIPVSVCMYEWRLPIETSANTLKECVASIRRSSGASRVTIVTHSFGGLVARAYIQGQAAPPVDRLYMIAPPTQGSVFSYAAWEGGSLNGLDDLFGNWPRATKILINAYVAAKAFLTSCPLIPDDKCRYDVFHQHVKSLKQLLPVGEGYLRDVDSGELKATSAMTERNDFLNNLNATIEDGLIRQIGSVRVFAGTGQNTPYRLSVRKANRQDGLWKDGEPLSDDIAKSSRGDGVVLESRATVAEIEPLSQVFTASHGDVIRSSCQVILADLGLSDSCQTSSHALAEFDEPVGIASIVVNASPANLLMTSTTGQRVGRDMSDHEFDEVPSAEFIDATDGTYSMIILREGAPDGSYVIQIGGGISRRESYRVSIVTHDEGEVEWAQQGLLAPGQKVIVRSIPEFGIGPRVVIPYLTR